MMFAYNGKAYSAWTHNESINGGVNNLTVTRIFESFGKCGAMPVAIGTSLKGREQAISNARANLRKLIKSEAQA